MRLSAIFSAYLDLSTYYLKMVRLHPHQETSLRRNG